MIDRRQLLLLLSALTMTGAGPKKARAANVRRLVFVHGRAQEGHDPDLLKTNWMNALRRGAQALGRTIPNNIRVAFPYYGDTLAEFARQFDVPLTSDIHTKGGPAQDEFLRFQAQLAEEMRQRAGVTDAQIDAEYGPNPKPKGPLNWEWVQAILRALDRHGGGLSQSAIETFTRDVFLYATRSGVRDAVDQIVAAELDEEPTVVVAHSLGTVVAYSVLRSDRRKLRVPLFVTVGCPLGIRAIRNEFRPLKSPKPVAAWYNAFDPRDVVALYPLDSANFPVTPAVENYDAVNNHTDNRHGIAGYLDDKSVAGKILKGFGA
jgi:hypothetical protein